MNTEPIFDASNRYVAPPQTVLQDRADGPWNFNTAPQPRAVFAFEWDFGCGVQPESYYHIRGGESDGSTVTAATLRTLGIAVPA